MNAFQQRLQEDVKTIFLGAEGFEEDVTYTKPTQSAVVVKAIVDDQFDLSDEGGLDDNFTPGLAALAKIFVAEADVPNPEFGDTFLQGTRVWNVMQVRKAAGMWEVRCSADERMTRV